MRWQGFALVACLAVHACSCAVKERAPGKLSPAPRGEKWGYVDATGNLAIGAVFDGACEFSERFAAVRVGDAWGYINDAGQQVIPPQFALAGPFHEGLAPISQGMYWGYANSSGRITIEPRFIVARPFHKGVAVVVVGRTFAFIDGTGTFITGDRFEHIGEFADGLAPVAVGDGHRLKFGYVNEAGRPAIEPRFGFAHEFSEGLAAVCTGERWGFIDTAGAQVIAPSFESAGRFSVGLAAVELGGKWGYIDRGGRITIEPRFDQAWAFSDGTAPVEFDRRRGRIDISGKVVAEEEKPGAPMGASPPRHTTAPEAEEYEIYSVVMVTSYHPIMYVMRKTEVYCPVDELFLRFEPRVTLEEARGKTEGIEVSTLDDLVVKPECDLEDRFQIAGKRIVMIDEFPEWHTLWGRHPRPEDGMPEVVTFSRVGFNHGRTQALVYAAAYRGPLNADGRYVLLEKVRGAWKVRDAWGIWMS